MSKLSLAIALLFPLAASAATSALAPGNELVHQGDGFVLAMGPDPGGHTGDGVTPSTTKTDHPAAQGPSDSSAGGAKSEKPDSGAGNANTKKQGETTGDSTSGQTETKR